MEEKRTIGYICPKCGAAVIAERSTFALSAGAAAVICDCGKSKLVLDYEGDAFHITVPCGICGGEHTARVDTKAVLTGRKLEQKYYRRHSGWVGGLKEIQYATLMRENPEKAMMLAVKGMLPNTTLGRAALTRVRIYKGTNNNHAAQKPEVCEF